VAPVTVQLDEELDDDELLDAVVDVLLSLEHAAAIENTEISPNTNAKWRFVPRTGRPSLGIFRFTPRNLGTQGCPARGFR